MKKFGMCFAILVAGTQVQAQTIPPQFNGSVFVQRKETFAVVNVPVQTLRTFPKGITFSFDTLVGSGTVDPGLALGGCFAFHIPLNTTVGVIAGVGATYNVASGFRLKSVTSDSIGLDLGIVWKF